MATAAAATAAAATATAATATAANTEADEASSLECPVCHELFRQPRVLPCGHLLCLPCLLSWGQAQQDAHCPLCRCSIVDASSGEVFEEVVNRFPTDLAMEALVDGQKILDADHPCQFCVTNCATTMCLTCRDFYCATCATGHKRQAMALDHIIEDLSSLTPEMVATSRPSICPGHPGKPCEVYCQTHGSAICGKCATRDHRSCSGVKELEEMVEEGRAALGELITTLRKGESGIDQVVDQLDQHLKDMQESFKVTATEIETQFQRLESAIKAGRQRLEKLLEEACAEVREAVNEAKNMLLQRRVRLTNHCTVTERAQGITVPDVVSGMNRCMTSRIDDLDCNAILPEGAKVVSKVKLVIDPEAVSRIERQLAELGKVEAEPAEVMTQVKGMLVGVKVQRSGPFRFHNRHGDNVVLTNDRHTAERIGDEVQCVVFSQDPMQINMMYEMQIDQTVPTWGYKYVRLGAVKENPDAVPLPGHSVYLKSAVSIQAEFVTFDSESSRSTLGRPLQDVREGGRLGLALDSSQQLHLFINNQHISVIASGVVQPCHFIADLSHCLKKVTALPVRPVDKWT